jgi:tripartite-type tricarboxylate transporter receptor subunit TctC
MVPPGINVERLAFLRQTIREVLNDPDIKAEFASKGQPIQFAPPEEVEAIINGLLGDKISPERLREIRHVILDKYY